MLCLTSAGSAFAESKVLPIPGYSQEKSNWCWVAGGQAILRYEKGTTISQCTLYQYGKNVITCGGNEQGSIYYAFTNMFTRAGLKNIGTAVDYAVQFNTIKNQINAYNGIITRIQWTAGGGHLAVIRGYDDGTTDYIMWSDIKNTPDVTSYKTTSYEYFRYSSNNGKWFWTHTRTGQSS